MQADVQKALQILEDSCLEGHNEACQRFMDVVKEGVKKNILPKTELLRQRILTIQQKLKKD
jgi:hypothetical protein